MELLNNCPICKRNSFKTILSLKDYFLTNDVFNISECQYCNFKITNPRPSEKELSKYYESDEYLSHSNNSRGVINRVYKLVRFYTLYSKAKFIKLFVSKGKLLDIGCGTGEFLNYMKKKKFEVTGIEPNNKARLKAIEKYTLEVFDETELDQLQKASFDIITLWHVLEHVYDLNQRIIQIKNLLKSNGILIIAVPNCDSFDAKHYKNYWAAYDVPRHLYHFNTSTLIQLLDTNGFSYVKTKPMLFDSFYVSILSEKNKTGKSNFLKGFYYGLISDISALFSAKNFSSHVYLFRLNNS
jgi:2-polyprenyl-3-methyl-5-hydroxy-6-metoxy-1,4-benzoquinol methylase